MTDPQPAAPSGAVPGPPGASPGYGTPRYALAGGGYGWRPTPPAPLGLGTVTVVLAVVWTLAQALGCVTSFDAAERYAAAGQDAGALGPWTAYDSVTLLTMPVIVAAYVVGCLWLQQSRRFAMAARPGVQHVRGDAWVWLGWVVPVVSFWFPFQVVRDVVAATAPRVCRTLGWWWAAWLVVNVLSQGAARVAGGGRAASALPIIELFATAAMVAACVLWIRIVHSVMAGQRAAGQVVA